MTPASSGTLVHIKASASTPKDMLYVSPSRLVAWGPNPAHRVDTTLPAFQKLLQSVRENGGVQVPIVVWTDRRTILDGHRRWTVAKELGLEKIPCIIYNGIRGSIQAAWAELNVKKLDMSAADWLAVYVKTQDFEGIPTASKGHIETCIELFGMPGTVWLDENGVSPTIGKTVRDLRLALGAGSGRTIPFKPIVLRDWIVQHHCQFAVNKFLKHQPAKKALTRLADAIAGGRPFKFSGLQAEPGARL